MKGDRFPKKRNSTSTAREGINFVRHIVESANCIFQEIEQHNDFGCDCTIEFVDDELTKGLTVAVQVKSGLSYVSSKHCNLKATQQQWNYWASHSLAVVGIVYDPRERNAHWTQIAEARSLHYWPTVDVKMRNRFEKLEINRFDDSCFMKYFVPLVTGRRPRLGLMEAIHLSRKSHRREHSIGVYCLIAAHGQSSEAWETLLDLFNSRKCCDMSKQVVIWLSHIPWHGDLYGTKETPPVEPLRSSVASSIQKFGFSQVLKLVQFLDDEKEAFGRGSLGQCVEAILSIVEDKESLLEAVIFSKKATEESRCNALALYVSFKQLDALPVIYRARDTVLKESEWPSQLLGHLSEFDELNLFL